MGIHTQRIEKFFSVGADVDQPSFLAWAQEVDKAAAVADLSALSISTTAPPGAPAFGVRYIVPAVGATGAWAGQANKVAWYAQGGGAVGGWVFITPETGLSAYVVDDGKTYIFNGTAWALGGANTIVANAPITGVGTAASPLDIDFAALPLLDVQAITAAIAALPGGDVNAIALSARLGAAYALNDLTNVNAAAPTNGQALVWNAGTSEWIAAAVLSAVVANAPITGNGTSGSPLDIDFTALASADVGAIAAKLASVTGGDANMLALASRLMQNMGLSGLNDTLTGTPTNGQALTWDGGIGKWRPATISTTFVTADPIIGNGSAGSPLYINFNAMATTDTKAIAAKIGGLSGTDTDLITLATKVFNVTRLDEILDVDTTGVNNGWVLKWNTATQRWGVGPDAVGSAGAGLSAVAVQTPLAGDGTAGFPLGIDWTQLIALDASNIALKFGGLASNDAGLVALANAVNLARPIVTNAPVTGAGTALSPLDVDFATLDATDAQGIAAAVAADPTAAASLNGKIAVTVGAPLTGDGTAATPLEINFAMLAALDAQGIAAALSALGVADVNIIGLAGAVFGAKALDDVSDVHTPTPVDGQVLTWVAANNRYELTTPSAGGLATVSVSAPLTGNGTPGTPLDINFGALASADVLAIATGIAGDAASLAILNGKVPVSVNAPITGNGTTASPLDVNFATLTAADAQAIATAVAGDVTAAASFSGKVAVVAAAPLTGNGTTATPLDVDFATMAAGDTQAIATKVGADATASGSIIAGIGALAVANASLKAGTDKLVNQANRIFPHASSSGALTPDHATYRVFDLTLTGAMSVNAPSAVRPGETIVFVLNQDEVGGRLVTWSAAYRWPGGTAPVAGTSNKVDLCVGYVVSAAKIIMANTAANA